MGTYGLRLRGVESASALLAPAGEDWPTYSLSTRIGPDANGLQWIRPDTARVSLTAGGHVDVDRAEGRATFTMPARPAAAALVHPHLASVAAVVARWRGRESFHAGGVEIDSGAWLILGAKGAGKSTLVAGLAALGHSTVTDDVAIVDRQLLVSAGPRLIDLRAEAADRLGVGEPLGTVGARERWRVPASAVPPVLPLRGFVQLAWGDAVRVTSLPAAPRVTTLMEHRVIRHLPPTDAAFLLDIASVPILELRRPRDWSSSDEACERLLTAARAARAA
jgi:hypothetical protein